MTWQNLTTFAPPQPGTPLTVLVDTESARDLATLMRTGISPAEAVRAEASWPTAYANPRPCINRAKLAVRGKDERGHILLDSRYLKPSGRRGDMPPGR